MFVSKYISLHFFVNAQNEIKMLYLFWKQLLLVPGRGVNLNITSRINVIIHAESLLKTFYSLGASERLQGASWGYKIQTIYFAFVSVVY